MECVECLLLNEVTCAESLNNDNFNRCVYIFVYNCTWFENLTNRSKTGTKLYKSLLKIYYMNK